VFLGSLKAGGSGIDLVAGSVVIHYDRWWNAAREDQATDRVHRIGQKSAVQVFKLVAQGTLEEKIAAIIERKRRLMDAVVQADHPAMS
jgi:SNF2 family DNA or RNA helicase